VGFVVSNAELEQVFSEYFGFPCQSFIPGTTLQPSTSSYIVQGWYRRRINDFSIRGFGSILAK
jgi:hypothetical protein